MTFYTLTRPGGPWDYPTLGFTAVNGAVLNGATFSPPITSPPDPFWAVGGSVESGVTRWGALVSPPAPAEPKTGSVLVYDAVANESRWVEGVDAFAPGTSLGDGLSARIATGTIPAKKASGTELRESFAAMANGTPPTTTSTDQTVVNYAPVAAALPYVRSGFLSTATPASAEAGSYRIAQLEGGVVRIGARFAFTPWSTGGGLLCLSIQVTSIATNAAVPVSPLHFTISPEAWNVDVNDTAGTSVENVGGGVFATALTADSTTLHSVEIVLDRDRGKCYVTLPDGTVKTLTDSRFSLAGTFVYVEPFKSAGSLSAKTDALVREWWADSRAVDVIPAARALSAAATPAPSTAVASPLPGTDVSYALNSTPAIIGGASGNPVSKAFDYPASGAVMAVVSAYLNVTTAGPVHLGIFDDTDSLIAVRTVTTTVGEGMFTSPPFTLAGTAGSAHTYKAIAYLGGAAVASLKYGNTGSIYYGAALTITPAA